MTATKRSPQVHVVLVPAIGEKCWSTHDRQAQLKGIYQQLHQCGRDVRARSIKVHETLSLMGEFFLELADFLEPQIGLALSGWVGSRPGRCLKLSVLGLEAQVQSGLEIEHLLTRVRSLQYARSIATHPPQRAMTPSDRTP
jgi:hypothetical protein